MRSNASVRDLSRKSVIHDGIVIKGELVGDGNLTISGCVEGGVQLRRGQLIITQTGYVEGDVEAINAHIDGEVRGSITGKLKVSIGSNARILGDVISRTLDISEGAKCNGYLQIGTGPVISRELKSQKG